MTVPDTLGELERRIRWDPSLARDSHLLESYGKVGYEHWQRGRWDLAHDWFGRGLAAQEEIGRRAGVDGSAPTVLDRDFTSVIGVLALLDVYVKQRLLAGEPLDRTVLFGGRDRRGMGPSSFLSWGVGNQSYLDYWREYFPNYVSDGETHERLRPLRLARAVQYNAWRCPDGQVRHYIGAGAQAERQWEAEGRPPLLRLRDDHRERGRAELKRLGVPEEAWFVGLHVRVAGYHDLRNSDVNSYWQAIEAIVERGGWVIRMGDRTMEPLQPPEGMKTVASRVIDYVFSDCWSDWMDVYLWADGRFLVGTISGPFAVPGTFGVPAVGTNWCPMAPRYWYSRDLYIPKQYRSERESRLLTFSEILSSPIGFSHLSEELARLGVRAIDNSPEQIKEVVVEMLDRLDGTTTYTDEDEQLYQRFDRMEPPVKHRIPGGGTRIGRDFLRANAHLLDDHRLAVRSRRSSPAPVGADAPAAGGDGRLRILFFMRDAALLRVYGGALRLLSEAGHEVDLAHDLERGLDEAARLAAERPSVRFGFAPRGDGRLWAPFAGWLRGLRDQLRYAHPDYELAPKLRARGRQLAPAPLRPLGDLLVRRGYALVERTLRAIARVEEAIPPSRALRRFMRVRAPDVVLVSPLVDFARVQEPALKAARALGIPAAVCVPTWDTLSNKGLIGVAPDRVLVWNDAQRDEAVRLHGVPAGRVAVTGAPVFDQWFDWAPRRSRREFCGMLGLDPDRPLLLYVCSSRFIATDERDAVLRWIKAVRASDDPVLAGASILVRPHPKHLRPWRRALQRESVVVWSQETSRFEAGHDEDYFDSIFHSSLVVGANTSAFIEAAILGRRVYTWQAPEFAGGQEGTLHFRQLLEVGGGVLNVARDLPEHVESLRRALGEPAGAEQPAFVGAFVRPFGLDTPSAAILAAEIEGTATAEALPLGRGRPVVRAAVLPLALLVFLLHHSAARARRVPRLARRRLRAVRKRARRLKRLVKRAGKRLEQAVRERGRALRGHPRVARLELRLAERRVAGQGGAADYMGLGDLQLEHGLVERALTSWEHAVRLDPSLVKAHRKLGYEHWQRGRWDLAHDWFGRGLAAQEEIGRRAGVDGSAPTVLDRDFTSVIGVLAFLDVYVKQRLLAGEPLDRTVLFGGRDRRGMGPSSFLSWGVGNQSYLDYWREYFPNYVSDGETHERLRPLRLARAVQYNAWRCPDGQVRHYIGAGAQAERQWEAEGRPPLLRLRDDHRERGRAELKRLGVPEEAWFVGLHVRVAGYHDLRNSDVNSYWQAIEAIVERGGWVIRMGDRTMEPLQPPEGMKTVASRVIDYVFSDCWSDWMDVYLWADGRFLVGTISGPFAVPGTFGVPAVGTNWCPMAPRYWYSRDLYIPKQYRSERESRLLTFSEILSSPIGFSHLSEELARLGVRAIDNSPEQIKEVVVEMLDRLDGTTTYTDEDEQLYQRFDRMEPPVKHRIPGGGTRIGRDFLRANAHLLDDHRLAEHAEIAARSRRARSRT